LSDNDKTFGLTRKEKENKKARGGEHHRPWSILGSSQCSKCQLTKEPNTDTIEIYFLLSTFNNPPWFRVLPQLYKPRYNF